MSADEADHEAKRPRKEGGPGPKLQCGGATILDIEDLHEVAVRAGHLTYSDPETGYTVMTRLAHEKRGKCCGCGCRHCPFHHENVKDKALRSKQPCFLHLVSEGLDPEGVTILWWSGGKDSFLALRALLRDGTATSRRQVVLATTFDAISRVIAHQEVHISQVERQAKHLDLSLLGIPLVPQAAEGGGYVARVSAGFEVVRARAPIRQMATGDLHLRHIRDWRESQLGPSSKLGMRILYPLWSEVAGSNYESLSADLLASGVPCTVSAVADKRAEEITAVGALYGSALAAALEEAGMDAFGESGELHTLAQVWEVSRDRALGLTAA